MSLCNERGGKKVIDPRICGCYNALQTKRILKDNLIGVDITGYIIIPQSIKVFCKDCGNWR
jgi:predicted RNase H-like nuclease